MVCTVLVGGCSSDHVCGHGLCLRILRVDLSLRHFRQRLFSGLSIQYIHMPTHVLICQCCFLSQAIRTLWAPALPSLDTVLKVQGHFAFSPVHSTSITITITITTGTTNITHITNIIPPTTCYFKVWSRGSRALIYARVSFLSVCVCVYASICVCMTAILCKYCDHVQKCAEEEFVQRILKGYEVFTGTCGRHGHIQVRPLDRALKKGSVFLHSLTHSLDEALM